MRMRWWRSGWKVAAPLAIGFSAALVLWVGQPELEVYLHTSVALLVAEAGLLGATGVLLVLVYRRRLAAATAASATAAAAAERAEHRRFLRRLDHELKNPLTAIRVGLANLVAGAPGGDPTVDGNRPTGTGTAAVGESVRAIDEQILRLSRLVADLRKLAEIGDGPLAGTAVDVGALLREAAAAAEDLPGGNEREIAVSVPQVPWPLPTVSGDRDLLELALRNLVANAVKYSGPGASVELRGFEENGLVVVEVADSGIGVPADEIPYVWDELVRGRAARSLPGSGLGLALTRTIVALHAGGYELRSRPGAGTVVRLRLPVRRS